MSHVNLTALEISILDEPDKPDSNGLHVGIGIIAIVGK